MGIFHKHDWELQQSYSIPVEAYTPWGMITTHLRYCEVYRCRKCGKLKTVKMKL